MNWQYARQRVIRGIKKEAKFALLGMANLLYLVIGRFGPIKAFAQEVSLSEKFVALFVFAFSVVAVERKFYEYGRARRRAEPKDGVKLRPPWLWIFLTVCSAYFFAAVSADSDLIFFVGTFTVFPLWIHVGRWYSRRLESEKL